MNIEDSFDAQGCTPQQVYLREKTVFDIVALLLDESCSSHFTYVVSLHGLCFLLFACLVKTWGVSNFNPSLAFAFFNCQSLTGQTLLRAFCFEYEYKSQSF